MNNSDSCTHSWVADTTSTEPNHPDGYVYCEHCGRPKLY
jgi:hypothetical protein